MSASPRRPLFLFCSACGAGPFDVDGLAEHLVGELCSWAVDAPGATARWRRRKMAQTLDELLRSLDACPEAREWAQGRTLAEAWGTCPRGDWMLWLAYRMAGEPGWAPHSQVLLAAAACAEVALIAAQSHAQRRVIEWMRWRAEGGCGPAETGLAVAAASDIAASDGAAAGAVARAADICRAMLWAPAAASE